MQNVTLKVGNIIDYRGTIVHQTNCVSNTAAFLAAQLFAAFPHADVYSGRQTHSIPGTIEIRGSPPQRIIALYGQVYPGKPKYPDSRTDGYQARQQHFVAGLRAISKISDLTEVAFPYGIGCGAAGGDWNWYSKCIEKFAEYMLNRAQVTVVKLPEKVPT